MKKILIILLFITSPLQAEGIEQLSWYNLQELLEDDKLTYKIIKSCVSLNSAVTELIKEEHPDLANEFFKVRPLIKARGAISIAPDSIFL